MGKVSGWVINTTILYYVILDLTPTKHKSQFHVFLNIFMDTTVSTTASTGTSALHRIVSAAAWFRSVTEMCHESLYLALILTPTLICICLNR